MKDTPELTARASADCLRHATDTLKGDLTVDTVDQERSWNDSTLRHVFSQTMNICHRLNTIELIFDQQESVVGFVDSERWNDCEWRELGPASVANLVRTEQIGQLDLIVREMRRGPRDCLEVVCECVPPDGGT